MLPIFKTDSYKIHHADQYPEGTEHIYSTLVTRNFKYLDKEYPDLKEKIAFGVKYTINKVVQDWKENFFEVEWAQIEHDIRKFDKRTLGSYQLSKRLDQFEELHSSLTTLPMIFKWLPDLTVIKEETVLLEIMNFDNHFSWLVNYIEVQLLNELWALMTTANISKAFYDLGMEFAKKTADSIDFVHYQFHDFSQRGLSSPESALKAGLGHLSYNRGTDNLQAASQFVPLNNVLKWNNELMFPSSIPATEHSVMCITRNEKETLHRLLEVYPTGPLSMVVDGYNFYNFVGNILPFFRNQIMAREGKIVIRPDSGNVMEILFGQATYWAKLTKNEFNYRLKDNYDYAKDEIVKEHGLLCSLAKTFGYHKNAKGYNVLDSHIGIIYGDGITYEIAKQIFQTLEAIGWSTENIVLGIGAYTYQYITRDTMSFAFKSSAYKINGEWVYSSKDPITDHGKKSMKGFTHFNKMLGKTQDGFTYEEWEDLNNA